MWRSPGEGLHESCGCIFPISRFLRSLIYLKVSVTKRREEVERSSIHCITPQITAMAQTGQVEAKVWNFIQISHVGDRRSSSSATAFPGTLAGPWLEVEQPRFSLVLIWDATSMAGASLNSLRHNAGPDLKILNLVRN